MLAPIKKIPMVFSLVNKQAASKLCCLLHCAGLSRNGKKNWKHVLKSVHCCIRHIYNISTDTTLQSFQFRCVILLEAEELLIPQKML